MQTQALWELFRDTGAPEAYLLYKRALQKANRHGGGEGSMYLKTQGLVLRVTEYRRLGRDSVGADARAGAYDLQGARRALAAQPD